MDPFQPPALADKPKFSGRAEFEERLTQNLSHTGPISSDKLLKGREEQLRQIDRAFASPRQHLFIIGERGVGKTSLAMTAWRNRFGSNEAVQSVSCDSKMTFDQLMQAVASRILGASVVRKDKQQQHEGGLDLRVVKWVVRRSGNGEIIIPSSFPTIDFAAEFLGGVATEVSAAEQCIVLDEFDRLPAGEVQERFADLIKAIHDKSVPVRFICCGVSENVHTLLGAHQSAGRSIIPVPVPRLSMDNLAKIIFDASAALGINVDREYVIRTTQISDGFPYFVHLLAHNLFFEVFGHIESSNNVSSDDFHKATKAAIEVAEYELREKYSTAVQKTKNSADYDEILWAFSEGTHFEQQIRSVYDGAYANILRQRESKGRAPLDYADFQTRVRRLQVKDHGSILVSPRRSWYRFCENRLRGYVRMVAQSHGVELGKDHF